ncbi:DUF4129 domain-containing protein [Luteimonas deserti]|uniref:DUF4129 domain-containing protein n=1 Tax=Luteimonas deserti TaxID=2752306 RepID=A0A7Z0QUY6_9GAMM|nr:DUF4129 domain-containing protein [Luteimonas deserti]NYZ63505.1 DUF4129 domain-containing protein [Luteimonas deserti]
MRVETVQVELRPRSGWEAMELGNALVRRHARGIWGAWLLVSLPLFAALNAVGWWLDRMWLPMLLLWWLLPLLDRVPLFVLSRAVFGAAPTLAQTVRAQVDWGWRPLLGYLTWRRFSPWRAVAMPVALLEGVRGPQLAQRRRVVVDGVGGHALLLTAIGHVFVLTLAMSQLLLVLLFVPTELLSESARAMWALMSEHPPRWVQLLGNLAIWLAVSAVAPFQVGAGFGLYLNRRTHLEAWDLEIAFRRLRARLQPTAASLAGLVLVSVLLAAAPGGHAQTPGREMPGAADGAQTAPTTTWTPGARAARAARESRGEPTLPAVFGEPVEDPRFASAVEQAYADPLLGSSRTVVRWQRKDREARTPEAASTPNAGVLAAIARTFALLVEFGLWILLGLLVLALALTARRWWPWMRGVLVSPPEEREVRVSDAPPLPEALPDALVAAVRQLWEAGERRRALALLYRGSVEAMARRADVHLVPGATEAECLRASRRMPDPADRGAFAEMVRVWQRAAYGQRLPDDAGLEALLATLAPRFGWAR